MLVILSSVVAVGLLFVLDLVLDKPASVVGEVLLLDRCDLEAELDQVRCGKLPGATSGARIRSLGLLQQGLRRLFGLNY